MSSKKWLAGGLVSALAVIGLVALPAEAATALKVQYKTSASGAQADQVEPWLNLVNTGTTTVPLNTVKIRYYFKAESAVAAVPLRLLVGGRRLLDRHRDLRHDLSRHGHRRPLPGDRLHQRLARPGRLDQ